MNKYIIDIIKTIINFIKTNNEPNSNGFCFSVGLMP